MFDYIHTNYTGFSSHPGIFPKLLYPVLNKNMNYCKTRVRFYHKSFTFVQSATPCSTGNCAFLRLYVEYNVPLRSEVRVLQTFNHAQTCVLLVSARGHRFKLLVENFAKINHTNIFKY